MRRSGKTTSPGAPAPSAGSADDLLGGLSRLVLDSVRHNIFVADPQLNLVYLNTMAEQTMRSIDGEVRKAFRVGFAELLGGSIHRFHRNPQRVESILRKPGFAPHTAEFSFGDITLETHINQVIGPEGSVAGYVVAWRDVSAEKATARRAQALTDRLNETLEVSARVQSVATATNELLASISEISRSSSEATTIVGDAVATVEAAARTMADLGQASQQISAIVAAISQIAHQTNLLALNATIEAARAGDAGRGFAVVAGEVKALSKQTETATEEINRMIESVQDYSEQAGMAIAGISTVVDRVNQSQASIAAAVEEQTATTNEITANLAGAARQAESIAAFVQANR
jgi:uncharacterized protein YoxC